MTIDIILSSIVHVLLLFYIDIISIEFGIEQTCTISIIDINISNAGKNITLAPAGGVARGRGLEEGGRSSIVSIPGVVLQLVLGRSSPNKDDFLAEVR